MKTAWKKTDCAICRKPFYFVGPFQIICNFCEMDYEEDTQELKRKFREFYRSLPDFGRQDGEGM